jgi:hypothetical protein
MSLSYNLPYGMVENNGIFYVADYGNQAVYTADPVTLAITGTFIDSSSISGLRPVGLVTDTSNNMYITNYLSGNIYRVPILNPAGHTLWSSGIPSPYSMAIDYTNNFMYVSSSSTGNIYNLDFSGNILSGSWAAGYNNLSQIVMSDPDNLYVADASGVNHINIPTHIGGTSGTPVVHQFNTAVNTGLTIYGGYFYLTSSSSPGSGNIINVYNFPGGSPVSLSWKTNLLGADYLYNYNGSIYATDDTELHRYNPYGICFLKGTGILCEDGYQKIEEIKPGQLVKTLQHGYVAVDTIKSSIIYNPDNIDRIRERLYLLSKSVYPELTENLVLTGGHSILVPVLTKAQREATLEEFGTVFVTEGKYRLLASLDERSVPYPLEGTFEIYHICLVNKDELGNYGIYANGLLVESCCKRHIN